MSLDQRVASYLAGYFDADGWVSIERSLSKTTGNYGYGVRIGYSGTNLEMLCRIQDIIGGKIKVYQQSNKNWKPSGNLRLRAHERDFFFREVMPFTILKRPRLIIAKDLVNRKVDAETAYEQVKEMNSRGVA